MGEREKGNKRAMQIVVETTEQIENEGATRSEIALAVLSQISIDISKSLAVIADALTELEKKEGEK